VRVFCVKDHSAYHLFDLSIGYCTFPLIKSVNLYMVSEPLCSDYSLTIVLDSLGFAIPCVLFRFWVCHLNSF
jgi:hypothetical protein